MFNLPSTTECNTRIHKKKFYENLSVTPAIKRLFIEQVDSIFWTNKIASSTMNVEEGNDVKEIEVFQINLINGDIDERVLKLIDKEIPYHIVFVLSYDNKYKLAVAYKEGKEQSKGFVVNHYFYSDWKNDIEIIIQGINLDSVYETIVRNVAGNQLSKKEDNTPLSSDVDDFINREKIKKEIEILEKKAKSEHQPKKKFEIVEQINKLKAGTCDN